MEFFPRNVRSDATLLRREFLKLAMVHHPDKQQDLALKPEATKTFQRIQAAYDDLLCMLNGPANGNILPRTKTALSAACEFGNLLEVKRLLKSQPSSAQEADSCGKTPLMYAVEAGSLDICKELLRAGASIDMHNLSGWTALVMAAIKDQTEIACWLLDSGAMLCDKVFRLAAHMGSVGVLEVLLGLDAPRAITMQCSGYSLLHVAVRGFLHLKCATEKHFKCVNMLLDARCDVCASGPKGDTVLWLFVAEMDEVWAAPGLDSSIYHLAVAQRLCELGADPYALGPDGLSAAKHADLQGRCRLLDRLSRVAKMQTGEVLAERESGCFALLAIARRVCEDWKDWWRSSQ
mmetsp:Transcript_85864/g.161669  ORF Transcript_85864/g.161669 Transcript_85864/m.161669 type:complete len:348 (-) Transcript_85864:19-1062(-)